MRIDGDLASEGGQPGRVAQVVRRSAPLMAALRAAREVAAPDWLISAGAIRDAVWDALHHRRPTAVPRDVDVGFFDACDLTPARDAAVPAALCQRDPSLPWETKNQAAVHLWYPRAFGFDVPPFRCCAEAVATFPEIASCVGVRLLQAYACSQTTTCSSWHPTASTTFSTASADTTPPAYPLASTPTAKARRHGPGAGLACAS